MDHPKFILGTVLYALTALGWFYIMKHIKLSTISVLFAVSSIIFLTFLGVVVFKERLNSREILGIILGLFSVILLVRFG
jgi:small multidrug resistance pump